MSIRVASFNVMNLFRRPRPMNLDDWDAGRPILEDVAELNELLAKSSYSATTKRTIKEILERNKLNSRTRSEHNFEVNQIRKKLFTVNSQTRNITVVAAGRSSWVGWVELPRETHTSKCIENTARVIEAVDADVVCLVEVEDRITVDRFNEDVIIGQDFLDGSDERYRHWMVVDGNDGRGIDVGLLSRFEINSVHPHVDDDYAAGNRRYKIFSRDCPEYEVVLPGGESVWVLVNHLKSKGYGSTVSNNRKRKRQATKINEILTSEYDLASDWVIVAGDLNDTPASDPLEPLMNTPNLHDVLDELAPGEDRWSYWYSGEGQQIDYLLVSRPLKDAITDVGVERRGIFSQSNFGGDYPSFPQVTGRTSQASDHAAIWADFDIG